MGEVGKGMFVERTSAKRFLLPTQSGGVGASGEVRRDSSTPLGGMACVS